MIFDELDVTRKLCRTSFEDFVRLFWSEVPGAGKVSWNWHMSFLCEELQTVAERVFKGLPKEYDEIVNISPGTSKSTICSILFPDWVWIRMPNARVITASHTESLAIDLSNKSRMVLMSDKFKECFPDIKLSQMQNSKSDFANTLGGERATFTVAGKSPTGRHAHFQIVDDPLDPKKARSDAELKVAAEFMTDVLPSRSVDKRVTVMFLIMQRLHYGDPTGILLESSKKEYATPIRHICLPATIEDPRDRERVSPRELVNKYTNNLMDPGRLPKEYLLSQKGNAYAFAGQYLQSPAPPGGGMFKDQYFQQRIKAAPYSCTRIFYVDRASTDGGGAYTAGVLLAKDKDNNIFVEDVIHGQWEPNERNSKIRAAALKYRTRYGQHEPRIFFERELGSSGVEAARAVIKSLAGFSVREQSVTGDKEIRAEPWASQLAAGNVYLVDNGASKGTGSPDWDIEVFIKEHIEFPLGRYKDQVDACSGAYNTLEGSYRANQALKTFSLFTKKKDKLRLFVCSRDELKNIMFDESILLLNIIDPPPQGDKDTPLNALTKILDYSFLEFCDIDPAEWQERWNDFLVPYDKKPEELVFTREIGKKLWAFLLKRRELQPMGYVFCDAGEKDKRALSIAIGVRDALLLPKESSLFSFSAPDTKIENLEYSKYLIEVVKASRSMVI